MGRFAENFSGSIRPDKKSKNHISSGTFQSGD